MNTFNVALLFAILSISIPPTAFALEKNVFMHTYELNVKELQKLSTHTIKTGTPWRESRTYKGYLLSDILSLLDFHSDDLQLCAFDDYCAMIPHTDVITYNPIVAYEADGIRLTMRDDGPFFLVYPIDSTYELQNAPLVFARLVRHVKSISWGLKE